MYLWKLKKSNNPFSIKPPAASAARILSLPQIPAITQEIGDMVINTSFTNPLVIFVTQAYSYYPCATVCDLKYLASS